MTAAGLTSLYDTRNGFLLCDQCHDLFHAFLWTVDSERKVVVSGALSANVPELAAFAGKQLFPDDGAAAALVALNRPLPGVWAWHFQAYERAATARHAEAALKLFSCARCKRRYVQKWRKDKHEVMCTAAAVPPKHFLTPAGKMGLAAAAGGGGGAGGGGSGAS